MTDLCIEITLVINKEFSLTVIALVVSGADLNCIQEGLIPSKYYEKSIDRLTQANGDRLQINYRLTNAHSYNDGICFKTPLCLSESIILQSHSRKSIYGPSLPLSHL